MRRIQLNRVFETYTLRHLVVYLIRVLKQMLWKLREVV